MEKEALFREIISEEKTIRNQMKFLTRDISDTNDKLQKKN